MWVNNILMCRPDHYTVSYEINPWMNRETKPAPRASREQWTMLHHTVIRCGGFVHYLDPLDLGHPDLPDMVFTANGGLVHGRKVVLPRFATKERAGEEKYFSRWFMDHGYTVMHLDQPGDRFEGNGDCFIYNDILYLGVGSRTSANVAGRILDFLGLKKLVFCELVDPRFYHLDTCFCPLNDGLALWYPGAFSNESQLALQSEKLHFIEVSEDEAAKFACNSVVLGKDVIIPSGCDEVCKRLVTRGYTPHPVAMGEFMKAGGAAKCLTLKV